MTERRLPIFSEPERSVAWQEARRLLVASKLKEGEPVRWRHQGRNLRGLDCLGVLEWVVGRLGAASGEPVDYSPIPDGVRLREGLERNLGAPIWALGMEHPRWQIRPGDIVLMRWHETRKDGRRIDLPNHVGILTPTPYDGGGLAVLHCYRAQGGVVEHRLAKPWDRRVIAVYSLTGGDW